MKNRRQKTPANVSNVSNVSRERHISLPIADPAASAVKGEHRGDADRADGDDRAGRIAASRRWQRSATGNPTLLYGGYRVVVVRHAGTQRYGYAIDRVWARGCWASEGEAKRAAAAAVLALPRKPRHRPARADRAGLTGWLAARAERAGRDDDFYDNDDGDADEQSERSFA